MHSIKFIRENKSLIQDAISKKKCDIDLDEILGIDFKRRTLIQKYHTLTEILENPSLTDGLQKFASLPSNLNAPDLRSLWSKMIPELKSIGTICFLPTLIT